MPIWFMGVLALEMGMLVGVVWAWIDNQRAYDVYYTYY